MSPQKGNDEVGSGRLVVLRRAGVWPIGMALLLLAFALACLAMSFNRFESGEFRHIKESLREGRRKAEMSSSRGAADKLASKLERAKVKFHIGKGNPYSTIDLSASDSSVLPGVTELTRLSGNAYSDYVFYLRLGPAHDDDTIPYLAQISGLEEIDVSKSSISVNGRDRLRHLLPKCKIDEVGRPW